MALQEELKTQGDFLFKNRSYLPLIILVIGLLVFIYQKHYNSEAIDNWLPEFFDYIWLGISLFGLYIRVVTVAHTPKNTSGRNTTEGQIAEELNTTGIYSIVRHPLYLGNFFMWLGVAMLTNNTWFVITFVLFYAFYYERIMYAEESFLRQKFGNIYLDWAKKTPAFMPSFKYYQKAKYPFSIKKALKKEKNGLAAVFLIFWVFSFIGEMIKLQAIKFEYDFWFYGALASSIIYIVLKIMKKQKLLDEINR
ncbi:MULTISPECIES: methyltransferase family protein [Flavobacteriaceae]|uniref:Lipid A phosphate methyltransferase n=1 Tax=Maribacter cobaltidurans TaxID=1178778 RepID=A0A223V671_9FLAO|nr:methyltransferase [Maribacter cobaltidurans]ASV30915.1 lipid A phosphate methyltransferase [Maribacter cobaltidurans]GGD89691.1 lipid A Kdo2 1-phosphate O-methyltransferase [Maribacter cobaltidurans]GMN08069.1 lipid A Kdo2 1-phosphate O-methyltransferase [Croceitalea sp. MTPC5]